MLKCPWSKKYAKGIRQIGLKVANLQQWRLKTIRKAAFFLPAARLGDLSADCRFRSCVATTSHDPSCVADEKKPGRSPVFFECRRSEVVLHSEADVVGLHITGGIATVG